MYNKGAIGTVALPRIEEGDCGYESHRNRGKSQGAVSLGLLKCKEYRHPCLESASLN